MNITIREFSKTMAEIIAAELRDDNDASDEIRMQRFSGDVKTLCLRHGKSRVINAFLDAWRKADAEGAKW